MQIRDSGKGNIRRATPVARERAPTGIFADDAEARTANPKYPGFRCAPPWAKPERRARGDAAVNEALQLRPDLAEVHLAAAWHLWSCYRDFARARVQIALAAQALSNNPALLNLTAAIDQMQGQWEKATADLERADGSSKLGIAK